MTVAYLVGNYFASILVDWWPRMKWLEPMTIFTYVDGPRIFETGAWPIDDMCVLLGVLMVSTVLGGIIWSRRDLPL